MYRRTGLEEVSLNFLWDIVLRAKQQGKLEEDLFFRQAEVYSPFFEPSFPYINEQFVEDNEIELNLLYRFADIFQAILSEEISEFPEFQAYFIDAALHMIVYTDLYHGLTKRDIYIRKLLVELRNGIYWSTSAEKFGVLSGKGQERMAVLLLMQMENGSSLLIFRRVLLALFPKVMLYQIKADRKKLLLYLREKPTDINQQMLQYAQDMFLPVSYQLRVFWEHHFGIIGVEVTMKIDEIALY